LAVVCFFLHASPPSALYTLSLHDALPILDLDHRFERMYMGRADDGTSRFFRLSEAPQVRLYKQDRLEALRQVMRAHNQKRGAVRSEEHSLNSSHVKISYAVFCLKKKKKQG